MEPHVPRLVFLLSNNQAGVPVSGLRNTIVLSLTVMSAAIILFEPSGPVTLYP